MIQVVRAAVVALMTVNFDHAIREGSFIEALAWLFCAALWASQIAVDFKRAETKAQRQSERAEIWREVADEYLRHVRAPVSTSETSSECENGA